MYLMHFVKKSIHCIFLRYTKLLSSLPFLLFAGLSLSFFLIIRKFHSL